MKGSGRRDQISIQDLCFCVDRGETLGIVGESGCGKTILVRALMKILPPSFDVYGKVAYEGKDIYQIPKKELNKIRGFQVAMISDNPLEILDPIVTIEKQVTATIRTYKKNMNKIQAIEKAVSIFKSLKIPDPEKLEKRGLAFRGTCLQIRSDRWLLK